jgi:DNA-binding beta-propeller fold protein YncE
MSLSPRLFSLFCVALLTICPPALRAEEAALTALAPTHAATIDYAIGFLAADPIRPRVYATVPSENSVIVIDTTSLLIVEIIPIGSAPQGLTVSADGSKLWVANSGSTTFGIGVIDLNTLTTLPSLPTPVLPYDIEEGPARRLYVSPNTQGDGIMQINGDTGEFQTYLSGFFAYSGAVLEVSPDRNTLFAGNRGISPSTLVRYDISTATAAVVQSTNSVGSNGQSLRVSHNGQFLVFPNGGGNGSGYTTFEIPTSNLSGINGSFAVGAYPTSAAFSNDDAIIYHGASSQSMVKIFSTQTFNLLGTIPLGNNPTSSGGYDSKDLIVDRTGRWLFVATSSYPQNGDLRVYDIGPPQLANISTRLSVGRDDNVLIGGLIITGNESKKIAVRAIGPSLGQVGVSGALQDPTLELHDTSGTPIAVNDDWQTTQIGGVIAASQSAEIQSRGLAPSAASESAIIATLPPGNYTAIVRGKNNTTGVAVVETYDLDRTVDSKLGNIATRGFVQTGANVMIGGTIVTGNDSANVLVRAIGPSLAGVGVPTPLADPMLELRNASGTIEASNDDWRASQETAIQATGLAPAENAESALLATIAAGAHTAIVRGKNDGTGNALVEIYQLAD